MAEIDKERLAHSFVVVLPGMDKQMLEFLRVLVHRLNDRRHFHEIRARTHNVYDF